MDRDEWEYEHDSLCRFGRDDEDDDDDLNDEIDGDADDSEIDSTEE